MAMASEVSGALYTCIHDVGLSKSTSRITVISQIRRTSFARIGTTFATGSPLVVWKTSNLKKLTGKTTSFSIRSEQSAEEGNGLDVWLGRLAMVGFAVAISVEIGTGKGLLQNFGLTNPLPTVALAVTALVGSLTAVFIFQSASKN